MAPSVNYHKGLLNAPGQNNCFLNSAVQVLWHLDIFRRSFRELSGHACMSDSCIFCALKDLFGQLQFSHERALPPDSLRKALAQSFTDQHRFQLGFMDDAAECFENILLRIHFHIAYSEAEDMCNAKHCIPHQKFAMTLVEQSVCGVCHATSEPLPFTQMVHYVSASALISQAEQSNESSHQDLFGHLLKKAGGMGDIRDCPSMCGAKIQIRRTLINRPEIVSVGIVWDSDRPSLEQIISLLNILRTHLRLSDVFHGSFDAQYGDNVYHQLVGIVTYYGKHYSTFFFHTKLRVWVYFDDANVREVGPHWEQVVEKCRRGRYQPLLLLFATSNGSPVDASNAPKSITLVDKPVMSLRNGHDVVGAGKPSIQRCSLSPAGSSAMGGRRSLTPSPEKPRSSGDLTQRRAVTPNPEQRATQTNQKPLLSKNDYQNLTQYQETIFSRPSNMCTSVKEQCAADECDSLEKHGGVGGGDHSFRKELVRRDSGNWSGDRNSASSSSSTSLENTYHYIIGKMRTRTFAGIPRSPSKNGDLSSGSGNSSGGPADPGYDSFSLSSTDSLPIQNLKHNFQLAQIPEGHLTPTGSCHLNDENSRVADDCERLCAEVDHLLDRSEQAEDLITALSLCNAAVNKARAAMDAPYSNPQTASFATMKHNACVLRARSLHRRLEEPLHNNLKYGESRHSREGSGCSTRGSGSSHSRQNSRDKGHHSHSRQNSQELLSMHSHLSKGGSSSSPPPPFLLKSTCESKPTRDKLSPSQNIEIYATLPKNKKGLLSRSSPKTKNFMEDEEYLMKERPGRSLLGSRSKAAAATSKKETEKRARSEERNTKSAKEMTLAVTGTVVLSAKDREKEQKDSKKQSKLDEKHQNKKQHKVRRKLLMGGLMRRKNRSMPDLRDNEGGATKESSSPKPAIKETSKDDSMVDSKTTIRSNLNAGYLSEGNLEYAANPNLERSKLMRKSFYGTKVLQFSKVPPPPPLRTTSQLSRFDQHRASPDESFHNRGTAVVYANSQQCWTHNGSTTGARTEPTSLPFLPPRNTARENNAKTDAITYSNGGFLLSQMQSSLPSSLSSSCFTTTTTTAAAALAASSSSSNTVVTEALIHHEASFQSLPPSVSEFSSPDHSTNKMTTDDVNFQLPPYPSPIHSALHSRQASEEFPPPPPTTLPTTFGDSGAESTFLAMLREKCETMAMNAKAEIEHEKKSSLCCGGESWLKELQAKQAERRKAVDPPVTMQNELKNVKNLKYKFEQLGVDEVDYISKVNANDERSSLVAASSFSPSLQPPSPSQIPALLSSTLPTSFLEFRAEKCEPISSLKGSILGDCVGEDRGSDGVRRKSSKKKNVTFCEQVVLVATAEDEESDNYIPNPILERVLRTVLHKETNVDSREHAVHSVVPLKRTDSWRLSNEFPLKSYAENEYVPDTHPAVLPKDSPKSPQRKKSTDQYYNDSAGVDANSRLSQNKTSNPLQRIGDSSDEVNCCDPAFISSSQTPNQAHSPSYVSCNAYSPPYITANSLCGSASNAFGIHRNSITTNVNASTSNEYPPDQITSTRESVENACDSISESYYEQYAQTAANVTFNVNASMNQISRKVNDTYPQVTRYSLSACHREASTPQKSTSGSHVGTYSSYQAAPVSHQPEHCSGSPSYQPMSLQYYPSLSRSSPQMQYRDHSSAKGSQSVTGSAGGSTCSSSSLLRHNSNASHYNSARQISPPHDPRRVPVSIPPPVTLSSPSPPPPPPFHSKSLQYCHSNSNNDRTIGGSSTGTGGTSHILGNEMPPSKMVSNNATASPVHHYPSSADMSFSAASNQHDMSAFGVASVSNQSSTTDHHSGYFGNSNSSSSKLPPRTISNHRVESTVPNEHQMYNQHKGPIPPTSQNHHIFNHRTSCSSPSTPLQMSSMYPSGSPNSLYPAVANSYESFVQTPAQHDSSSSSCTTNDVSYSVQNACNATHQVPEQTTNDVPHHAQCNQLAVSSATSGLSHNVANAQQMQHASSAISHHNAINPLSPHQYSSNLSNSSSYDSLSCRPSAAISPYLSVLHNSSAHELHSRCSNSNGGVFSTSYQSSPPPSASSSYTSASCTYQTTNKFGSTSHRSHPPPVYQHPPPPPSTSSNGTKYTTYQRVPTPHQQARSDCNNPTTAKYPVLQQPSLAKHVQMQMETKKTNVAATAGIGVVPCNLCRKKQISPPSVYCTDCNFYLSRFRQKI